jgi:hypothetical protein
LCRRSTTQTHDLKRQKKGWWSSSGTST